MIGNLLHVKFEKIIILGKRFVFCSFRLSNKASSLSVVMKESWLDVQVRSGYKIEVNKVRNINKECFA